MPEAIGTTDGERLTALLDGGRASDPAIVVPENNRVVTYGALADSVTTLAGRLASAGVRRGDRVAFVLPNGPDLVQILLAISALGAGAAPLNPAYTESEFSFYLEDIAPRLLLISPAQKVAAGAAAASGTGVALLLPAEQGPPHLVVDGIEVDATSTFEDSVPDDVALILHTSGTTSRPKQVPLRQRNLMASIRTIAAHYRLGSEDVSYCAMPLFHVHGIVASALAALSGGGSTVVPTRFTPHRFWGQARDCAITWVSAGPTLHQMILDKIDDEGPPSTLRFARSCSSALSPALMHRAEELYGVPMLEAYGMTEASHQMASNPLPPAERFTGSVGIATGIEMAVVDSELRFLSDGTAGEIVIRGPGVTAGYVNNNEANTEAFFDGWFRTGDRGVITDGYLRLEGRLKEMILRGGENISPAEIEEILLANPFVTDAVCFGVENEKYGEVVSAAVTLSGSADERALIDWCRVRLAGFKVPETIHILAEIPRTATGKVQRRRVAEFIAGGMT